MFKVEQLADHTGEESLLLTASVNDGTLSHLGSGKGKHFIDGKDDLKSQFLSFCLKREYAFYFLFLFTSFFKSYKPIRYLCLQVG